MSASVIIIFIVTSSVSIVSALPVLRAVLTAKKKNCELLSEAEGHFFENPCLTVGFSTDHL